MAYDLVTLYNLALSAVGTEDVLSLPTEDSREAEICNRHYPIVRDIVLRAAHWPSARATKYLSVLATRANFNDDWQETDPLPDFRYAYAAPADYLYPRYSSTWGRFEVGVYGNSQAIFSNESQIIFTYTKRQENLALWGPDLFNAVYKALAAAISMPLHGKTNRTKLAIEEANAAIMDARVRTANENTENYETLPEWFGARGYGPEIFQRYIYPYGPMFTVGSAAVAAKA